MSSPTDRSLPHGACFALSRRALLMGAATLGWGFYADGAWAAIDGVGPKSDSAGVPPTVGLFRDITVVTVPDGTDRIRTTGFATRGSGGADYAYDPGIDAAYVAAHPRSATMSANDRGFRLLATAPTFRQLGMDPTGVAGVDEALDEWAATPRFTGLQGEAGDVYLLDRGSGVLLEALSGRRIDGGGATLRIGTAATQRIVGGGRTQIILRDCVGCRIGNFKLDGNGKPVNFLGFRTNTDTGWYDIEVWHCGDNAGIFSSGNLRPWSRGRNIARDLLGTARGFWLGNLGPGLLDADIDYHGLTAIRINATGIVIAAKRGVIVAPHSERIDGNGSGLILTGGNGCHTSDITVLSPRMYDCTGHGLQSDVAYRSDADLTRDIRIIEPDCSRNNRGSGSGIYGLNTRRWSVSGGRCSDNRTAGVQFDDRAEDCVVKGTICEDTRSGTDRTQLTGARIVGGVASPKNIAIDVIARNNVEMGAQIVANAGHGVRGIRVGGTYRNNGHWGIFIAESDSGAASVTLDQFVAAKNGIEDVRCFIKDVTLGRGRYGTSAGLGRYALPGGDTSPSVPGREIWSYDGPPVAITMLDDMPDGATRYLYSNGLLSLTGGGITLKASARSVTVPDGHFIALRKMGGRIFEIARNF